MSLRTLAMIGGVVLLILLLVLGWEGRALRKQPPESAQPAAKSLDVTLLPEYKMAALQTRKETVERPLLVPTRRPAPPPEAVAAAGPSKIQRGQFILSGTAIQGQTRLAFLRNAKDGKPRTVRVGDVVDGMTVSVVAVDRIVLAASGEQEELLLKVATGPKGAVTPVSPPLPIEKQVKTSEARGAPQSAVATPGGQVQQQNDRLVMPTTVAPPSRPTRPPSGSTPSTEESFESVMRRRIEAAKTPQ